VGSEVLPIYKSALNLAVYMEQIVRDFQKYHKYTMGVELREKSKTLLFAINRVNMSEGLDFLGYIIRPHYTLVRQRVVNNFKKKKAKYLENYEDQQGKMKLSEIKAFLSVKASFASHTKHANSYNLNQRIGALHETNPFDYART
jgi:hypothetical protein